MVFSTNRPSGLDANRRCTTGQPCIRTVEISALEEKIAKLEAQFKVEQMDQPECAYLHNVTHDPLNCVPPEVASAILCCANPHPREHYSAHGNPRYYLNPVIKVPTRPLELASVCRRWRELAFSEPRLWTNVVMRRSSSSWSLSQDLVNQWIARSGGLPLVIVLVWDPTEDPADNEIVALVKYICALSHQWRSVVVRVPSAILQFFHCDNNILLDLEHFTFVSTNDDGVGALALGQTTLRPVTATFAGLWTPPTNILCTNITRFDMFRVIPTALLSILTEFTQLNDMWVSFIPNGTGEEYPQPTAVINLPYLTRMAIDDIQEEHAATFFMHLETPALRHLRPKGPKMTWRPKRSRSLAYGAYS